MTSRSAPAVDSSTVQEMQRLLQAYGDAVRQLRIPAIDRELYEECIVLPVRDIVSMSSGGQQQPQQEGPRCLSALKALCQNLDAHHAATLRVLELCHRRDELVAGLLHCCELYEGGAAPPSHVEVPAHFTHMLDEHHAVTLLLVEAIFNWREQLTRPFPFNVAGENYIYRILEDCDMIDASALGEALQLRLNQGPLGSQSGASDCAGTSSGRVRGGATRDEDAWSSVAAAAQGGPSLWCRAKTPSSLSGSHMAAQRKKLPQERDAKRNRARVAWGEAMIKNERLLQRPLLQELSSMADQGRFVTLLATPELFWGIDAGLPFVEDGNKAPWRERLVMLTAAASAANGTCNEDAAPQRRQKPNNGVCISSSNKTNGTDSLSSHSSTHLGPRQDGAVPKAGPIIGSSSASGDAASKRDASPTYTSSTSYSTKASTLPSTSSSSSSLSSSPSSSLSV